MLHQSVVVVNEFAGRVLADERVNKKFAKTDAPRLTLHLVEQICAATGGPCEYTGKDMKSTHKNMKVTEQDVIYVADLANLELTDRERVSLAKDLNSILEFVDRLNELDTSGIPPMAPVMGETSMNPPSWLF